MMEAVANCQKRMVAVARAPVQGAGNDQHGVVEDRSSLVEREGQRHPGGG